MSPTFKTYQPAPVKPVLALQSWYGLAQHTALLYLLNGSWVPFDSTNPAIALDMAQSIQAAEIYAVNMYWKGPKFAFEHKATLVMLKACEQVGLKFSVRLDKSAVSPTLDLTQQYIGELNYLAGGMMQSPAYDLDDSGRAYVLIFDEQPSPATDWNAVVAERFAPMSFLFRNGGPGYSHPQSDGAFGWVSLGANSQDINLAAINTFVNAAAQNPTKEAWYPTWSGFGDYLASTAPSPWGGGRTMEDGLGETFIKTCKLVPATAKRSIHACDFEEGTQPKGIAGFWQGVRVAA